MVGGPEFSRDVSDLQLREGPGQKAHLGRICDRLGWPRPDPAAGAARGSPTKLNLRSLEIPHHFNEFTGYYRFSGQKHGFMRFLPAIF